MNFTEIVAEVVDITKRPDKLNSIRRNVNSAISLCCLGADFARDHDEVLITRPSVAAVGNFALTELVRFRKIDYILPASYKKPIEHIEPSQVFQKCQERKDCFYVSGDQINFSLSASVATLTVGYFRYPPTLNDADAAFWLLDAAPYMVIDKAASITFKGIGDDASARTHEADFRLAYDGARQDLKHGVRYG